jgi:hypothetical protein
VVIPSYASTMSNHMHWCGSCTSASPSRQLPAYTGKYLHGCRPALAETAPQRQSGQPMCRHPNQLAGATKQTAPPQLLHLEHRLSTKLLAAYPLLRRSRPRPLRASLAPPKTQFKSPPALATPPRHSRPIPTRRSHGSQDSVPGGPTPAAARQAPQNHPSRSLSRDRIAT